MAGNEKATNEDMPITALPSIKEILLDRSLYDAMPVNEDDLEAIDTLRRGNFQIDAFCIYCNAASIFKTFRSISNTAPKSIATESRASRQSTSLDPGYFGLHASCVRCSRSYTYYFLLTNLNLSKIGQYPSLEDIGSADLVKYRKFLSKGDYAELKRASGLFAHGIGIGSFVYLRRIFERLISVHHQALANAGTPVPNFDGLHMDDKIKGLASVLPPALVKHRKVYSILSIGIHGLDEETCRKYFPVVKAAILQMLDQDMARKELAAAEALLESEIAAIVGEVKSLPELVQRANTTVPTPK